MLEKEVKHFGSALDSSLNSQFDPQTPVLFFFFFYLKALLDEQRHHVCEGSRALGYALQICRADEHPNAFQVTVR